MTAEQKKHFRKLFQSFFDVAVDLLQSEHGVCFHLVVLFFIQGFCFACS